MNSCAVQTVHPATLISSSSSRISPHEFLCRANRTPGHPHLIFEFVRQLFAASHWRRTVREQDEVNHSVRGPHAHQIADGVIHRVRLCLPTDDDLAVHGERRGETRVEASRGIIFKFHLSPQGTEHFSPIVLTLENPRHRSGASELPALKCFCKRRIHAMPSTSNETVRWPQLVFKASRCLKPPYVLYCPLGHLRLPRPPDARYHIRSLEHGVRKWRFPILACPERGT